MGWSPATQDNARTICDGVRTSISILALAWTFAMHASVETLRSARTRESLARLSRSPTVSGSAAAARWKLINCVCAYFEFAFVVVVRTEEVNTRVARWTKTISHGPTGAHQWRTVLTGAVDDRWAFLTRLPRARRMLGHFSRIDLRARVVSVAPAVPRQEQLTTDDNENDNASYGESRSKHPQRKRTSEGEDE